MGYLYILECVDGSYYVGSTTNLEARVQEHNLGKGTAYTRKRRPVVLKWSQQFDRIEEAYAREKQVQGWSRAKREALMEGRLEDLPELSRSMADRSAGSDVSASSTTGGSVLQ
ncbi:putative endonuclease [Marmoricola sp. OAE513]|uniref:GIY-YIG nuclease family protein n=1 Tax=Marmoricola sp. OAE513 TaxID=2817894 RepID=UPI001AE87BBC